ncbi:MAG TPA: hypothetical protein VJS64_05750 [Pyrinomonadaceae bacterium]|nr:hypothetical protein [Pyrinomonadaceae bacterium]
MEKPSGQVASEADRGSQNESGSVVAAQVIFRQSSPPIDLEDLLARLQTRLSYPCSRTKWVGLTTTIPQIRISTPTLMFLQIEDDPSYVPEEIREIAETAKESFDAATASRIAKCDVRIDILGPAIDSPLQDKRSLEVGAAKLLDPSRPEIDATLRVIADTVGGYVYDNVNGKWLYAFKNGV